MTVGPPPILDIERVDTYRGPAQILRGVSLSVREGEAVCLVGRNGAGKTTTIDTIIGLLSPRAGRLPISRCASARNCAPARPSA